ncbi:MAG TPA: alpha/beta fold hydrolase [Bacillota bacterium]|nr:alpha/beta fold hydrolase [Bacillota bacterium]
MKDIVYSEDLAVLESEWPELTGRFQQAWQSGETTRLELALEMAKQDYHHPACEIAGSKPERRSFCFTHQQITQKSVLLIHGFTACPFEMRELGQYLYGLGYNVFGVRLAGHGTSIVDFANSKGNDWVNSTRKGLAVAALLGYETVVVGESMGGALAVLLAQTFPSLVHQLVLCAPCFQIKDFRSRFAGWKWVQRLMPYYNATIQYGWQYDYWYTTIPLAAVAELAKISGAACQTGPGIAVPTLVIQAENDQMVIPQGARRFFNSLTKVAPSQKELKTFPDGHHNLTVDLNPRKKDVFEWVGHFIETH